MHSRACTHVPRALVWQVLTIIDALFPWFPYAPLIDHSYRVHGTAGNREISEASPRKKLQAERAKHGKPYQDLRKDFKQSTISVPPLATDLPHIRGTYITD